MVITGYARLVMGNLTPGEIIDAETAALGDPALLAAHCLAKVDPDFAARVAEGDVLFLAGELHGGSGAEAAVIALQAVGIAAVVCERVAPELTSLGAIYGLPVVVAPGAGSALVEGDLVRLDLERGRLAVGPSQWEFTPIRAEALASARRAQLLARMRRVVEDEGYAE